MTHSTGPPPRGVRRSVWYFLSTILLLFGIVLPNTMEQPEPSEVSEIGYTHPSHSNGVTIIKEDKPFYWLDLVFYHPNKRLIL